MPRACPVEIHVGCYTRPSCGAKDATGLHVEIHAGGYTMPSCGAEDATGLPRGVSRSVLRKGRVVVLRMPQACPVEFHPYAPQDRRLRPIDATGFARWSLALASYPR